VRPIYIAGVIVLCGDDVGRRFASPQPTGKALEPLRQPWLLTGLAVDTLGLSAIGCGLRFRNGMTAPRYPRLRHEVALDPRMHPVIDHGQPPRRIQRIRLHRFDVISHGAPAVADAA